MADLLCLSLKKGSEVDLVKPLKNLISSLYSTAERPEDFTTSINELNKLRSLVISKNLEKNLPSLELLYRYHDQITALQMKIPPSEIQIPFKWKDAFDKGSLFGGKVSLVVPSLAYEKVCILFNIAAMQSQVGALDRISDTDEELKASAKLFQSAGGILHSLKSAVNVLNGQDPTPDLSSDALSALSALMLAQAQEIFVTKSIQDKMKDAIVAKLCVQAEDMYADALRLLQKDSIKHLWDKEWLPIIAGKQAAYSALSQYFQSQVCNINKLVGEQITRLGQCIDILKQAQIRSVNTNFFSSYVDKATRQLAQAKKDNDFIYHERIPEANSLATIEKVPSARLARCLPVPEAFATSFKDLFSELVPVAIHQAIASCEVRKGESSNSNINKLRENTQLLNSILASLNLPHAIEDSGNSQNDVPPSLKEKANQIREAGGLTELYRLIGEMPELVKRNREILDEAERMLNEEEESDSLLKSQLKEKWTRTPSDKLNGTFKTNASRYREIINNAHNADAVVNNKFSTHREGMEILSGGEESLAQHLPKMSIGAPGPASGPTRESLRNLMTSVENLKSEREELERELKMDNFDFKTPFLTALAQDGAINEPAISAQLLGRAFAPLESRVAESLTKQERLVATIQEKSDEFFGRKVNDGGNRRDELMRQIAEAFDAYTELQNNVKEGTKFYNDLTQLLLTFQNKISDYCFARKTEKEELLKDVTRDASAANTQAPPPRPPQPIQPVQQQGYGAPPQGQQPVGPGMMPYPAYPQQMPMPYHPQASPYPVAYTPMPAGYNPYGTYPPPSNYPYPVQQMGYAPPPAYFQQPPPQQPPQ